MSLACCSEVPLKIPSAPNAPIVHTSQVSHPIQQAHPVLGQQSAFMEKDQMITMLQEILKEQSSLLQILQQNQQAIVPRLDEISASVSLLFKQQEQSSKKLEQEFIQVEEFVKDEQIQDNNNCKTGEQKVALSQLRKKKLHVQHSLLERILMSTVFEIFIAIIILTNMITMFISLQLRGLHEGWRLGQRDNEIDIATHEARFEILEHFFNTVYVMELLLRILAFRCRFFKSFSNILDFTIVLLSCLDSYIFPVLDVEFVNVSALRVMRLTRILRLGKVLRSSNFFSELRVLIRTLYIALRGIFWSAILLSAIIIVGGIVMAQLTINFLDDPSINIDRRIWMYKNFGTSMAAVYTIFESTMTTSWIGYSRPLMEEVGYFFVAFWIPWVGMVNFTTIRIVQALFLKATLGVSARDAENCAMMQLKRKGELAEYLRGIFTAADTSGDGAISQEEFDEMMSNDEVVDIFADMGLDVDEVAAFYSVLAADDGYADYNEFITGALAMASSAPNLDRLKSLQNQMKIQSDVSHNLEILKTICHHFKLDSRRQSQKF